MNPEDFRHRGVGSVSSGSLSPKRFGMIPAVTE
jgi:hypothetical protein